MDVNWWHNSTRSSDEAAPAVMQLLGPANRDLMLCRTAESSMRACPCSFDSNCRRSWPLSGCVGIGIFALLRCVMYVRSQHAFDRWADKGRLQTMLTGAHKSTQGYEQSGVYLTMPQWLLYGEKRGRTTNHVITKPLMVSVFVRMYTSATLVLLTGVLATPVSRTLKPSSPTKVQIQYRWHWLAHFVTHSVHQRSVSKMG